jgi:hypothetical protein
MVLHFLDDDAVIRIELKLKSQRVAKYVHIYLFSRITHLAR